MKRLKIKKLNNEGAALILAMVIVLFVTVLTSLLLYVSGVNYEMKTTEYRTKVSFYGAETPLEELRVQLAADASEAAEKAYKQIMKEFSAYASGDARYGAYEEYFYENMEEIWKDRGVFDMRDASQWQHAIGSVLGTTNYDIYLSGTAQDMTKPYHIEIQKFDVINGVQGTTLERDEPNGRILLLKIKVYYTEEDFLSIISTDYAIDVPDIDWTVDKSDTTTPGVSADDVKRTEVFFEKCVSYLNWEKQ